MHMRRNNTIAQKASNSGVNRETFYKSNSTNPNEIANNQEKKRPLGGHIANQTAAQMDQKYQLNAQDLLDDLEEEKEMAFDDLLESEDTEATEVAKMTNKNTSNQMKKPTNNV